MNSHKNKQKGFTILVAVITAGILLIIAMSIGGIALKEQVLATSNKESQIAFYAADTGLECALYWDQKKGVFGPETADDGSVIIPTNSVDITCNNIVDNTPNIKNIPINVVSVAPRKEEYNYAFMVTGIPVGAPGGATTCAVVTVSKDSNDSANGRDPNKTYTDIYSRGYNTCDASLRRLERGVDAQY